MNAIFAYFPELTDKQIHQIEQLQDLYSFWNSQINVISRKDIDNLYRNHVLHSVGIAKLVSFKDKTTLLDVGTGGGFPGIPLSILFPHAAFHLIDSIGKKIKVAQSIAAELGLVNVRCSQVRAEQIKGNYDFILSRAVSSLPVLYQWVHRNVSKQAYNSLANGFLCFKGGNIAEELQQIPRKWQAYPLSDWFEESYFIEKYIIHIPC
jgi:16S rRNA (guanine527-N7)-methyltransferase